MSTLQNELARAQAQVAFDYPDARTTQAQLSAANQAKCLLVVHLQRQEQVDALESLSDFYLGWPILAIVDSSLGTSVILEAQRKGASQVIVLPLQSADFEQALARISKQYDVTHRTGEVIVVAGTTEGCGATTVAMGLAYALAEHLYRETLLVEMALHLGRLAGNLDLQPQLTTAGLFADLEQMDYAALKQSLPRYGDHLRLLTGPFQAVTQVTVAPAQVQELLTRLHGQTEVLVVDLPATFDEIYFAAMAAATRLVLVTEQSVPAVQALSVVRDAIERHDILAPQWLVLNRYDQNQHGMKLEKLEQVIRGPHFQPVPSHYAALQAAMNAGKFVAEVDSSSPLVAAFDRLANAVLAAPTAAAAPAKKHSPLNTLLKYLGS